MIQLAPFEVDVLNRLTENKLPSGVLLRAIQDGEFVGYEHTGVGYYYKFRHPDLPSERRVCDKPMVLGEWCGIQVGFLAFVENNELMLECCSWGDDLIPADLRSHPL